MSFMKKCTACKSLGINSYANHKDYIYQNGSESTSINLCYGHSVELFKTGQSIFVLKYKPESIEFDNRPKEVINRLSNYFVFNTFR
jgi:hypothetical protein